MKRIKVSLIINSIIVILTIIGCIFMFTGFTFMPAEKLLEVSNIEMFKFYTVDSNILMGIVALIYAIYEYLLLYKLPIFKPLFLDSIFLEIESISKLEFIFECLIILSISLLFNLIVYTS